MWDAIVIGSGIGGLAASAALGKHGKRALLLEQHSVAGGQTQTFRRQDWQFATGVHYIGGVGPQGSAEGQFGRLLAWLSDGALQFAPCANPYDIVRLPGFEFGIAHPEAVYRAALQARFPAEQAAIDRWFQASHDARKAAFTVMALHSMPPWLAAGLRLLRGRQAEAWARHTLGDELARIGNPQLRAVLGARWGDYGAPPATAPFVEHALVTGSYDAGAYYPVGGPARFAQTLLPAVQAAGGECRLGAEARRILVQDGKVAGVEVMQDGVLHTEHAAHVISDMGAANTVACLPAGVAPAWRDDVRALRPGLGFVALYLGLEGDIAAAGASSANHWIYEQDDIGRVWQQPADEDAPALFVSFASLKDPSWQGPPTAEVLALVDHAAFEPWLSHAHEWAPDDSADAAARVDGDDYVVFKDRVAERLRAQFDRHFPALAPMVRFQEAATPRTQQHFTRTLGGSMYGLEMTGDRIGSTALNMRTPVAGLLLAGQDVAGPGVQAAFMAGMMAAAAIDGAVWRDLGR
ncbi:MAG: NAD(P)/FAD-dependent oxidoreductase [Rhizobacter sp.]|nr:NAD(P)/FAD-dependent oxidoreductase [Rhizobacter sp.]